MEKIEELCRERYRLPNGELVLEHSLHELLEFAIILQHEEKLGKNPNFTKIHQTCNEKLIKKINEEIKITERKMLNEGINKQYYTLNHIKDSISPGTKNWYGKRRWDGTLTATVYINFYEPKNNS